MNLFIGQQWRHRHREQTCGQGSGRGRRERNGSIYTTICKIDSQWKFACVTQEFKPGLCNNLEGWERVGGGRKVQEEGDTCTPISDSCRCTADIKLAL